MSSRVLILDFGSQYTQLIARRVRELNIFSEVHPCDWPIEKINEFAPSAIVLSGGPDSVLNEEAPSADDAILELDVPMLGICYGQQWLSHSLGGEVKASERREFGRAELKLLDRNDALFSGIDDKKLSVWMSHGDAVAAMPKDWHALATTDNAPFAIMRCDEKPRYGVQFHPEVAHTPRGLQLLKNFLVGVAGLEQDWTPDSFIEQSVARIKAQIGDRSAICGLSGGVDSSVAAMLVDRAIGDKLTCIFVDNGLLRKNEAESVVQMFSGLGLKIIAVDAADRFLHALEGVDDPEKKRKIIGKVFIDVFEEESNKIADADFLVQGTLYPDVIESVSHRGPSAVIKSHHNVGGLPERMKLELTEPLRLLFKDEVREVGTSLGLPHHLISRQPFPGPGLAIRCPGVIERDKLEILRNADAILDEEIRAAGLYEEIWQSFCVLIPIRTVGVMGDERTYEYVIGIRAVDCSDGMTADWTRLPYDLLARTSNRIINETRGCNRVVYDISSKPPATIEWE